MFCAFLTYTFLGTLNLMRPGLTVSDINSHQQSHRKERGVNLILKNLANLYEVTLMSTIYKFPKFPRKNEMKYKQDISFLTPVKSSGNTAE